MAVQSAHAKVFVGVSVLLFAACTSVTVVWCKSMSALGGTPMRGGWTMSMAWMRMPGQSWLGAAASFLAMWVVMTVAMMLPSLVPSLWRYREALRTAGAALGAASAATLDRLTAFAGAGYLFVWTLFGVSVFPLGIALAGVAMRLPAVARAVPIASGVVVLIAGTLQLTAWKARHLDCCRALPSGGLRADAAAAWRYGLRMGRHCSYCCSGLTASLLVIGVNDLRAMAIVTAAVNIERFAGKRLARAIGAAAIGAGIVLIAREAGLGSA